MDTIRPATTTPDLAEETNRRPVKELTFLLGPPFPGEAADLIARIVSRGGVDPDRAWGGLVFDFLDELLGLGCAGGSVFDHDFSCAYAASITVWDVRRVEQERCGRSIPGFAIAAASILDEAGRPVELDLADPEARCRVAGVFMGLTDADWFVSTVTFEDGEEDELGFLNPRNGNVSAFMKGESMTDDGKSLTERDAAEAWARAYNLLDAAEIAPLLAEDVHYASQWVFEEIESRADYLHYLEGKLDAVRRSGAKVLAELAETRPYPMYPNRPRPCVVVQQGGKLAATVLFEVAGGRITKIDMCQIPPPETCRRLHEFPGLDTFIAGFSGKGPGA